ncbi:MAG: carbon-nitrogen hydrolase family protein [Alphaproteobacteria bacterium]|jgi:predicted amidohydrolase|nr:carbon-nitrogen hydrolase family protein [Alphaproteobacteria bacterium]MDP6590877.1 carbon-nitrogen hydrolase family protein [Alphaproteobacteria bacterium]MDP6818702.1 carbon-nitrogen hydrolase family protein [Alphaproteobacteria bacterium]
MSENKLRVACVQPSSGQDMDENLRAACELVRAAEGDGARLIALPENVALMDHRDEEVQAQAAVLDAHPAILAFAEVARETGAWIVAGSVGALAPGGRVVNCSAVIDGDGAIAARYDKIHMFDVDLPNGEVYRESAAFRPGDDAVIAETPWGGLGMSICYDLRFPQLYRALAHGGADIVSIPAAFTKVTGEAVWHVLNRARAIESAAFVISPCMWGSHSGGRKTFGHSLIIDPWGTVLADAGEGVGYVTAEIDLAEVAKARAAIPALRHDRDFNIPADGKDKQAIRAV